MMNKNVYLIMAVFVVGVLLVGCAPEMPEDPGGLPDDPAGAPADGGAGDFPDEPVPGEPDDFPEGGEPIGEPIQ